MRAEYDSEADALSIYLIVADRWDGADEDIDDTYCHVPLVGGEPANIELLNPREHLSLLGSAAVRYGFEPETLFAAANAALSAPDSVIELALGARAGTGPRKR